MKFNAEQLKTITPLHLASPSRGSFEVKMIKLLSNYLSDKIISEVADLGCGWGEYRFLFQGFNYVGIDINDFDYAAKGNQNNKFICADITALPLANDSIDLVLCNFTLEYIVPPDLVLAEVKRVLKNKGNCFFVVPTAWVRFYELPAQLLRLFGKKVYLSGGPNEIFFSKKDLLTLFKRAGLKMIKLKPAAGFFTFLLKSSYIYYRAARALWLRVFFRRKVGVLPNRQVGQARNVAEYKLMYNKLTREATVFNKLYVLMQNVARWLDERLLPNFATEWMVLASKE